MTRKLTKDELKEWYYLRFLKFGEIFEIMYKIEEFERLRMRLLFNSKDTKTCDDIIKGLREYIKLIEERIGEKYV